MMYAPSRCSECGAHSTNPPRESFDVNVVPGMRHHALLSTNEIPEGSEVPFVQSLVSETDSRLASLDDAISKLRGQLKTLEEARTSLLTYRTRNSAILSPLRKMPPEVLGEIFLWTLPSLRDEFTRCKVDVRACPWVLTHVSSGWRTVAHSTPSLWSRVVINYETSAPASSAYPSSLVEAQLQRSQKLNIHIRGCEETDFLPQILMFQLLSQHSSRWEELSVRLTPQMSPLLAPLRDRIPSLKRLWIDWTSPESQTAVQSIDCFQTAGSLVDVGIYNEFDYAPVSLPMHQLTRYEVEAPWDKHLSLLPLATRLVEARIDITSDREPANLSLSGVVELLHLRRLYVSNIHVLGCLRLPALEELGLWIHETDKDIVQILEAFIGRSACPLRRLCVERFPDVPTTVEILHKLSAITQLVIIIHVHDAVHSNNINALMSALTVSDLTSSTAVAPQLISLLFGCENTSSIDYSLYLEMVKSRWKASNCALRSAVLLTEVRHPDPDTLHGLHTLRGEGLDLLLVEGVDARAQMIHWTYLTPWTEIDSCSSMFTI
ncbi:F-box domain-containing protein [Mycena venus]|uniref:F-box domain-containing protein n=1 Tax=Mycena venus TaxID=2733690 RepID=A0A8H6XA94_9AGAR|nr:F-box domain-containing protein [Mycena venus]